MAGPIDASIEPGTFQPPLRSCSAAIPESTAPANKPSLPTCNAATAPDTGSWSSTGTQSAAMVASATPGVVVTSTSAGAGASPGARTSATTVEWRAVSTDKGAPAHCETVARLAATAWGSSPTWSAILSVSKGGKLTPPVRSVKNAVTDSPASITVTSGSRERRDPPGRAFARLRRRSRP